MSKPMFSSTRVNCSDYIEHVYMKEGGRRLLVATVYETIDRKGFKFSCKWKLFSDVYRTVADAKRDLFQVLEFHTKSPVDLTV